MTRYLKILLAACTLAAGQAFAAAPLPVVASFSILADVARAIGGERVKVETLVGPDQDAHVYQARPADIQKIRAARVVLVNGLGFEGASIQRAVRDSKVYSLAASKGIPTIKVEEDDHDHKGHDHGHDHGDVDPHVWTNPAVMQRYAQNVAGALIIADPEGRLYYGQRLLDYQQTLRELDTWAAQQFDSVPKAERKVLTGHDAFAYLGKRYDVQFLSPQGTSTESEASARTVAKLIQQVKQEKVKAVFVENIKDPRLVQQLAKEAGVTVQTAPLYADALSPAGGPATSYVNMMRHNVTQMVKAMK